MNNNVSSNIELYLVLYSATVFFVILAGCVIYFIVLYQKKQAQNKIEKKLLQSQFDAELIKTQLEIQEQTMQTIGAELHDNIGQLLSLTSLTLNSIELDNTDKAQQKIDAAIELNLKSIKEMRLLGRLLHGEQLLKLGLEEAIRSEITWIEKSGRFVVVYDVEGDKPVANNADKDLILFRITQEILNNIIKHSQAKEITIKLGYLDTGIRLQIIDNGTGFSIDELPEAQKGMGLKNIQKRAEIVGGEVFIQSTPGEGTFIDIFIPYP
jgi:two-component system, NarL family, sensor kinase